MWHFKTTKQFCVKTVGFKPVFKKKRKNKLSLFDIYQEKGKTGNRNL